MLASVIETSWPPTAARLTPMRLSAAKKSYLTRHLAAHLDLDRRGFQLAPTTAPRSGDVVLARVAAIPDGQLLEAPDGRGQHLYPGDEVLVAYGSRIAAEIEGEVPPDLGPVQLLTPAGTVGRGTGAGVHLTRLDPLGLLADDAGVVNMTRFAPFHTASNPGIDRSSRPRVLAVVAADAAACRGSQGRRSVAAASLVLGLTRAGSRVAAGKATGSAAVDATGVFRDSGAPVVLDFTDFGYASTYDLATDELARLVGSLILELCIGSGDAIVIEVGDDLGHEPTRRLVSHPLFAAMVDAVVVAGDRGIHVAPVTGDAPISAVRPDAAGLSMAAAEQLRDPALAQQLVDQG